MAADLIPEPPDGACVLVGEDGPPGADRPLVVLLVRDDQGADEGVWWPVTSDMWHAGPFTWAELTDSPDAAEPLPDVNRRVIRRLFTQAEVDRLVAEALGIWDGHDG